MFSSYAASRPFGDMIQVVDAVAVAGASSRLRDALAATLRRRFSRLGAPLPALGAQRAGSSSVARIA
jgi:hypothetical protein